MSLTLSLIVLLYALFGAIAGYAQVVYVNVSASGSNDGTGWADAFSELQSGLQVAVPGTEIHVAQGSYYTAAVGGDRSATFLMANGVSILGGYRGGSVQPDDRDPATFVTTLSGDINRDDGANWANHSDNSYHVVTATNVDSTGVLDGVHVCDGYYGSGGFWSGVGGGIYIEGGSPRILACTIAYNLSGYGGGVFVNGGTALFENCQFVGNFVWGGGGGRGGGFANDGASYCRLRNCTFTNNLAEGTSTEGVGGGIYNAMDCRLEIVGCVFDNNTARNGNFSSGIYPALGGGVFSFASPVTITDCIFRNNHTNNGGGVFSFGKLKVYNSVFTTNVVTEYTPPSGGGAGGIGGGLCVGAFFEDTSEVVNCVFVHNTAHNTGGVHLGYEIYANQFGLISNCILWGNSDVNGSFGKAQYGGIKPQYSCVQNLFLAPPDDDPPAPEDVPGCVDTNPQFVDDNGADNIYGTADDNVRIQAISPCIDAGENGTLSEYLVNDLDGQARRIDDPNTVDTGTGNPPIVDMGAYEYHATVPLEVPAHLVIQALGGNALLHWYPAIGAAGYLVYRDVISDVTIAPANLIGTTADTLYTDINALLNPTTARFYAVVSVSP